MADKVTDSRHWPPWKGAIQDLRSAWTPARWVSRRNLRWKYRDSLLGLGWILIPPLITALALWLSAGRRSNPLAQPFEAIFGLTVIQIFLDGLFNFRSVIRDQLALLRSRPWGLEISCLAAAMELGAQMIGRLLVLVGCALALSVKLFWTAPLGLLGILGLGLLGAGCGLLLAPLVALRRGVDHSLQVLPWLLFAVTPIFLPWTRNAPLADLYYFNPFAWVVQSSRALVYSSQGIPWLSLLLIPAEVLLLGAGYVWVRLWRPHLLERMT